MSKPDQETLDPELVKLAEELQPKFEELTKNPDYAVVCMVIKRGDVGVQTYTNVSGLNGVIMDGLFHELASEVEAGNMGFFALLAETIFDVEEEFALNMTPNIEFDDDSTLH